MIHKNLLKSGIAINVNYFSKIKIVVNLYVDQELLNLKEHSFSLVGIFFWTEVIFII